MAMNDEAEAMDEKTRALGDYRKLFNDETDLGACMMRDKYAQYMYERWGDKHTNDRYGREWANRFAEGRAFTASDKEGRTVLLKMMMGEIGNNVTEVRPEMVEDVLKEVTDDE